MTEEIRKNRPGISEIAKYIVSVLIIIYVVLLLLFASGSSKPFEDVAAAVSGSLDTEMLTRMDDRMLKRNFGLNSADYDGVMYYASTSSMSVEEVLLIRVDSRDQIQQISDAIDERIDARMDAFEGYAPDQVRLLEDAQQSVRGRYVFFAVSSRATEYRNAFDTSL